MRVPPSALLLLAAWTAGCAADSTAAPLVLPAASAGCIDCHAGEVEAQRAAHAHRTSPQGCLLCHGAHAGPGEGEGPAELRARCEDCHSSERALFDLPFRHPLRTGLDCTSCHPPHGLAPRELREHLRRDVCVECHREYEGPFQFEHEGDRNLQCLSCHEPHGSANRRLLTHAQTRFLCLSCHADLEQIHVQNPGSIFRDCLTCHVQVHGSQWSRELYR